MHQHKAIRTVLEAVQRHPLMMSPVLLEYLLRGDVIGRMAEKGLLQSPYHGKLADFTSAEITASITECLERGWLMRTSGFYPALTLSPTGERRLMSVDDGSVELSPEYSYKVYCRWRQNVAKTLRKPPYRIVPNQIVNHLAATRPTTLDELLVIPGLGKRRALRYQEDLLTVGRELATMARQG